MRSIVLSGFMATGKTTVGPRLAERLGAPFVDSDHEIEREAGKSIAQIWREEGEVGFRAREEAAIERLLSAGPPKVVALGGGAVTSPRTRRLALDRALVITLRASPESVVSRIADIAARPNLALGGDPVARARALLAERAEAYAECHLAIDTDVLDVERTVDAALRLAARDPLVVPLGARSYAIDVCDGEPARLAEALRRCAPSSLVVVTDSNVERARGAAVHEALRSVGVRETPVVLAPGESQKNLTSVGAIWDAALGGGVDREAVVVAVGGGVVGDLAGFAAACLLRGVRVVQVPTTVLSMMDASVGGKTGFDHPVGKNLIGAFHQPSAVVADLAHLSTLPERERRAGLAEAVKIALATDAPLLEALERDAADLAAGETAAMERAVRGAIQAKIRVVRDDEREAGARALLNLGHTVGHALESHGGYTRWLHGEAVALGLMVELQAMVALGWTKPALVERTRRVLGVLGLPTRVATSEITAAWPFVAADKKRAKDQVRFAVVGEAGAGRIERVALSDLQRACASGISHLDS